MSTALPVPQSKNSSPKTKKVESSDSEPLPNVSPLPSPSVPTAGKSPTPSFRPFQDSFYQEARWQEHESRVTRILQEMDLLSFARAGGTALADLGIVDVATWVGGNLNWLGLQIRNRVLNVKDTPKLEKRYSHLAYLLWEQSPMGVEPQMAVALLCQWAARDYFMELANERKSGASP